MKANAAVSADPLGVVSALIETGNVDTLYRDVFLGRARTLLTAVLPLEEFRRVEGEQAELAALPLMIGRALERAEWQRVKELSSHGDALRRTVEGTRRHMELARDVYAVGDVRLDPFSPGLLPFARVAAKDLPALRTSALEHLAALERADAAWKDLYARRRAALQAVTLTTADSSSTTTTAAVDPREAARHALKSGDMRALARLAETLMAAAPPAKDMPVTSERPAAAAVRPSADLLTAYSEDTLRGARRLGLAARRLEAEPEIATLRPYTWNPLVADDSGRIKVKDIDLPVGTPEAFRERLEMLMIHPLVNSGGARHLPTLVAEDVLVEDFPDPKQGDEAPPSELIASLGLSRRRGLSRLAIEDALLARGADILERDLGLDPHVFRLVCIPPDVHLRLGEAERWGRQPFWTHFDGYLVMADGRLRALAGGDVRYGGLYDLLGISRDNDSDAVMARFAVVQRQRMVAR